jgi:hypothetical protein
MVRGGSESFRAASRHCAAGAEGKVVGRFNRLND